MPKIICKKHGGRAVRFMCEHLYHDLTEKHELNHNYIIKFWGDFLICRNCFEKFNIAYHEEELNKINRDHHEIDIYDENSIITNYLEVYDKVVSRSMCCECFNEIINGEANRFIIDNQRSK